MLASEAPRLRLGASLARIIVSWICSAQLITPSLSAGDAPFVSFFRVKHVVVPLCASDRYHAPAAWSLNTPCSLWRVILWSYRLLPGKSAYFRLHQVTSGWSAPSALLPLNFQSATSPASEQTPTGSLRELQPRRWTQRKYLLLGENCQQDQWFLSSKGRVLK